MEQIILFSKKSNEKMRATISLFIFKEGDSPLCEWPQKRNRI